VREAAAAAAAEQQQQLLLLLLLWEEGELHPASLAAVLAMLLLCRWLSGSRAVPSCGAGVQATAWCKTLAGGCLLYPTRPHMTGWQSGWHRTGKSDSAL